MRLLKLEITPERLTRALGIKNARVYGFYYDSVERKVIVGVESDTFPEVPEGCVAPLGVQLEDGTVVPASGRCGA